MNRVFPQSVTIKRQPQLGGRRWWLPTPREWLSCTLVLLAVNALLFWRATAPSLHIADTLWLVASRPLSEPRGMVLPLFDGIALLGLSLIQELRTMHIDLPIEVPHCGDLSETFIAQLQLNASFRVRTYDVCREAAAATEIGSFGNPRPLFCENLRDCHTRFRSFDIKVLAVLFSRFEELMLLDADILFLQNPMSLWDLPKFTTTGTLFFNDRISFRGTFLAQPVAKSSTRSQLHQFVETFNRVPFQRLPTAPSTRRSEAERLTGSNLSMRSPLGVPSAYLQSTHAWQLRAGHHADSSLMLWSKLKQPRATAILASFITLRYAHRPPSYGDKELYFLACEVAEAEYAFSDFGVGSIGVDARLQEGVLCGDALQFYPEQLDDEHDVDVSPLYINSDHIASWRPDAETFYRSNARLANLFPGSFEQRNLPQECPFDLTMQTLTAHDVARFQHRQQLYHTAETLVAK